MDIALLISQFGWVAGTILDTRLEVHAMELGVVAGVVVAILKKNGFERAAFGLLSGLLVLSICVISLDGVPVSVSLHRAIQRKPWYFGTGLVSVYVLSAAGLYLRATTAEEQPDDRVTPFAD